MNDEDMKALREVCASYRGKPHYNPENFLILHRLLKQYGREVVEKCIDQINEEEKANG